MTNKKLFNKIAILACTIFIFTSCKKSLYDQSFKGNTTKVTYKISDNTKADTKTTSKITCTVDTTQHTIELIADDTDNDIYFNLIVNCPLVDFNIYLGQQIYGSGTVYTIFNGVSYFADYGNLQLHVNSDHTVGGTFFYRKTNYLIVTEGIFTKVPYTIK